MKILGKDASPDQIRRHLTKMDVKTECFDTGTEKWVSPITGETFETFFALSGHIGAYTRTITHSPLTEDRKGYNKALRRGIEPTPAQIEANREYIRERRRINRAVKRANRGKRSD